MLITKSWISYKVTVKYEQIILSTMQKLKSQTKHIFSACLKIFINQTYKVKDFLYKCIRLRGNWQIKDGCFRQARINMPY